MPQRPRRNRARFWLGVALVALVAAAGGAAAETFPAASLDGPQVRYAITGATLGPCLDRAAADEFARTVRGELQGDTLRIAGSVGAIVSHASEARAIIRVTAGDVHAEQTVRLATTGWPTRVTRPFDVSVKIPADATRGTVAFVVRYANVSAGRRSVTLRGTLRRPAPTREAVELSGPEWVQRFPVSRQLDDPRLQEPFRTNLNRFYRALLDAGATVSGISTVRPPERAYLMAWAWSIAREGTDPGQVPPRPGVPIVWLHRRADGQPDLAASKAAAAAMVEAYGIVYKPSLTSNHINGTAVDWHITWTGDLAVKDASGKLVTITTTPRSGGDGDDPAGNAALREVAATYGLHHLLGDWPHWSANGR